MRFSILTCNKRHKRPAVAFYRVTGHPSLAHHWLILNEGGCSLPRVSLLMSGLSASKAGGRCSSAAQLPEPPSSVCLRLCVQTGGVKGLLVGPAVRVGGAASSWCSTVSSVWSTGRRERAAGRALSEWESAGSFWSGWVAKPMKPNGGGGTRISGIPSITWPLDISLG